jgi:hypothetical protein
MIPKNHRSFCLRGLAKNFDQAELVIHHHDGVEELLSVCIQDTAKLRSLCPQQEQ